MLLILLCVCMGGTPVIENPGSSMIWMHERFQWLLGVLQEHGITEPWPQNKHDMFRLF